MPVTSPHSEKSATAKGTKTADRLTPSVLSLELRQILHPLWRWWWALLVVPVLSGAIAYFLVQHSTHYYQARTLVNIGPSLRQLDKQAPMLVTIRLGAIYSQIINQEYFLTTVAQQSNSGLTEEQIRQSVVAYFNSSTPFLEIQFVDSNADRAKLILKTMSDLLTHESPRLKELRSSLQRNFLQQRQQELTRLIDRGKSQLEKAQATPGPEVVATDDNLLQDRAINGLKNDLEGYQEELQEILQFTSSDEPNQIQIIEQPHIIPLTLGPQPKNAAIALACLSLVLLVALILLIQKLDSRVNSPLQVEQLLGWRVIPSKKRRQHRLNIQFYDLLAAELIATYNYTSAPVKIRLLMLYEQNTADALLTAQSLAESLARLGLSVKVYKGQSTPLPGLRTNNYAAQQDIIETFVASSATTEDPIQEFSIEKATYDWEIVTQSWLASPSYIARLSLDCTQALVLCSLRRSRKKTLADLSAFLRTTRLKVTGVLLV